MKMNKKALKVSGIVLAGALIFGGGFFGKQIYTYATSDWQTNALNNAQADLKTQAYDKAGTLSNQASTDINNKINAALSDEMKAKQDELNTLMEQYYQMKLNGMTDTQAFKDTESQIENLKQWSFEQFKYQIDQVFATQTKQ